MFGQGLHEGEIYFNRQIKHLNNLGTSGYKTGTKKTETF